HLASARPDFNEARAWANLLSVLKKRIHNMRYLIGRYHEIALKGRNQWRFVDQVKQNLRDIFGDYRLGNMRSVGPRLMTQIPDELSDETAAERAALIFGLQNFSLSYS